MPKDSTPKTATVVRKIEMSDLAYSEQIRDALPDIAAPIRPGELVATWIERAHRATGIPAARLRAYWHRKVQAVRVAEWLAVMGAAEAAARRRIAIAELEADIEQRATELARDHDRLAESHPVLVFLAPRPSRPSQARQDEAPKVTRRAAGRRS